MDHAISFVTLAVVDLAVSRRFYLDGLGWPEAFHQPGEVCMLQSSTGPRLSLWQRENFEAEVGPIASGPGLSPFTLAHNVATEAEVDEVLDRARRAGADPVQPAVRRDWGGYSGYFADPDGVRWEIATPLDPLAPPDPSTDTLSAIDEEPRGEDQP